MKTPNLKGRKFGKLKVLELMAASRNGSRLWKCQCDCGNIVNISTRHLNRKNYNIRSCGCMRKIKGKNHRDWKGYGGISGDWWATRVMRSVRSLKSRKGLEVSFTIRQAWNLFKKQKGICALTGIPLIIDVKPIGNASLDRIDSSKGYIKGNLQWVHKDINFMKRNYSQQYYIEMCHAVANNNISQMNILTKLKRKD